MNVMTLFFALHLMLGGKLGHWASANVMRGTIIVSPRSSSFFVMARPNKT